MKEQPGVWSLIRYLSEPCFRPDDDLSEESAAMEKEGGRTRSCQLWIRWEAEAMNTE
jgi:hypothetical protein